ncbi:hypothetical protein BDV95DRAFT_603851 [Massariosphaeria phaeospora]|uniref:FAD/NAD(P)-binding domain-containing protein n=1 Tax=Massariosphaeria phaeospora TaxID=100035 RepID=A0A7C8MDM0_9PLEO|nr:hypothetical protein BDV95DRAFT_603851 [Massariosphaeria phaeospora]
MAEERNIVVLGASISGLMSTHYIMKFIFPALKAKHDGVKYRVCVISPSTDYYHRIATPRTSASTALLPADKLFWDLTEPLKQYPTSDISFIQGTATGWDTTARTVKYMRSGSVANESLTYHALIVATGSNTFDPAYSMHTDSQAALEALKYMNAKVSAAKDIIIVGGGPTGTESAGEIGELLNGKPGWFSTPPPKVNITLITATIQLLPTLRPAIAQLAEAQLKKLGVKVLYNTRVADVSVAENKRTTVTLAKGEKLEADLYIPAYGVRPNTSFVPSNLLTPTKYLDTNAATLRVDAAGPRVYALGDVASYSCNNAIDIQDGHPVLMVNLKRDLLAFDPAFPNEPAPGKDRIFTPMTKEMMIVPIGTAGGVGAIFGWKVPSWFVWAVKGRDYMIGLVAKPLVTGERVKKEYVWTKEEAVA